MPSRYNLRRRGRLARKTSSLDLVISSALEREAPRTTYLDLLSSEEVENVVRYMSTKPLHRFWISFIETCHLFLLFRVGGPLSKFCLKHFTAVTFCEDTEGGKLSMKGNGDVFVRTWNDYSTLMNIAGPGFAKVAFVDISESVKFEFITRALSSISNVKCLHLRSIYNNALFKLLLSSCSDMLESLTATVNTNENVIAMVENCGGLHSLNIVRNDGPHCILVLTDLWITVGKTLRSLCLRDGYCSIEQDFRCIQTHCRNLRSIEITETDQYIALAMLCASFGDQVEHARFSNMPPAQCALVVHACPKLISVADYWITPALVALMPIIGPGLKELDCHCVPGSRPDLLGGAMNHCSNLKILRVNGVTDRKISHSVISSLFLSPKPDLETLELRRVSLEMFSESLNSIATNTGRLLVFSFSCARTLSCSLVSPSRKAFGRLVRANPLLERVTFDLHEDYLAHPLIRNSVVLDIIEIFSECPLLRELSILRNGERQHIGVSAEAIKACAPFRLMNTYVSVGDDEICS